MEAGNADFGAINEKHQKVEVWLEEMYGGESVPQFELNQTTITLLHTLMLENQKQDHNSQLIIDDLRQKAVEYRAEGERLAATLKQVRLGQGCLSRSGVTSLQTLVSLALHLELCDAADSSYLLGLQCLSEEMSAVSEERGCEETALVHFSHRTKTALHKYSTLLRTLRDFEEKNVTQRPETEKKRSKVNFLIDKAKQYKSSIQKLQSQLARVEADPSIYHQTLLQNFQNLQQLKKELAPLKRKLQSYHDLPPDLSQTKVKIAELKQQVSSLEAELTRKIDLMHL